MKKILILLLLCVTGALSAQNTTAPIYPLRGQVRVVYGGDTVDIFFNGDTTKFKTNNAYYVFNKPIYVNKDVVALQKDLQDLIAIVATKEPYIEPTSGLYYLDGNKTWQLFPSSLSASDVYPWAKEPEKPVYTASEVGLGNVDNTSDIDKPISTLTQEALDVKANSHNASFTGTTTGITKDMVGLGLVDNTSDIDKPVSTATQTALDSKQDLITLSTALYYYRGDKVWATLNKAAVGLGNVDNTSDANKPVSIIQQDSLDAKLGLYATAANSNLLQGKDSAYIKENWGGSGGGVSFPPNTTGKDVLVAIDPLDNVFYYLVDSIVSTDTTSSGGGTTLNGLGFVKATGTDISYDNTTYQPLITASGVNTQYYDGTKTFRALPVYTASNGVQKTGNDFSLGGTTGDVTLKASDQTKTFSVGNLDSEKYGKIYLYTRDATTGKRAFFSMEGGNFMLSTDDPNALTFGTSAAYAYDVDVYLTTPLSIPSLLKVQNTIHDSLVGYASAAVFPDNTTGEDIIVGRTPDNQTIYYKIDSLLGGNQTFDGTGYVKMSGTDISYDNRDLQTQLSGTGFVKSSGTTISYDNSTYEPAITAGSSGYYWNGLKAWTILNSAAVGLGNVNNTSDANKPVSTATQTALDLKQNSLGNPTTAGWVLAAGTTGAPYWVAQSSGGTTHDAVTIGTGNGLTLSGQQLSLTLATTSTTGALSSTAYTTFNNKVSFPGFGTTSTTASTGDHLHTGTYQPLSTAWNTGNLNLVTTDFNARRITLGRQSGNANIKGDVSDGAIIIDSYGSGQGVHLQQYVAGNVYLADGGGKVGIDTQSPTEKLTVNGNVTATGYKVSDVALDKTHIGLTNVDNTSDANKPISTATQTALNAKQATISGTGFVKASGTTISYDNTTYQAALVSGTNIKTVNSNSLVGSGNVSVGTVTSVAAITLGTTGTDLSSTVATGTSTPVITLNVPTASASNRGVLSSTDWNTFNGKQAALVSGTNIKTINSTTVLGSGNFTLEPALGNPGTSGYVLSSTTGGTRSWVAPPKPKVYQNLTSASTITMNTNTSLNANVTLTSNTTITLSNLTSGDEGNIIVKQDATGGRTITLSPTPEVISGGDNTIYLTSTANAVDIISYTYNGTTLYVTYGNHYN